MSTLSTHGAIALSTTQGEEQRAALEARARGEVVVKSANQTMKQAKAASIRGAKEALEHLDSGQSDTEDEVINEVEKQLRRLLQPPTFAGATPSTPFRIATLVNNELAEHNQAYLFCEATAKPLLEKWFSEHPTDVFTAATRDSLIHEATMQRLSSMSVADRRDVIDAFSYFGVISPKDRMELFGQHADSASAAPLLPAITEAKEAESENASVGAASSHASLVEAMQTAALSTSNTNEQFVEVLHDGLSPEYHAEQRAAAAEAELAALRAHVAAQQPLPSHQQNIEQQVAQLHQRAQARPEAADPFVRQQLENIHHNALAQPEQMTGSSPAFVAVMQQRTTKNFEQHIAANFQSNIVGPQQQEIDRLRSEVARLSGVLQPSDPRYQMIHRETMARFAKPGGKKLFDRRRLKFITLRKMLTEKEQMVATLLEEIGEVRLNCILYADQVDRDSMQRVDIGSDQQARVQRWEEEEARRQAAKEERIRGDQEPIDRRKQQRSTPMGTRHADEFLPAQLRAAAYQAPGAYGANFSVVDEDMIDDADV